MSEKIPQIDEVQNVIQLIESSDSLKSDEPTKRILAQLKESGVATDEDGKSLSIANVHDFIKSRKEELEGVPHMISDAEVAKIENDIRNQKPDTWQTTKE